VGEQSHKVIVLGERAEATDQKMHLENVSKYALVVCLSAGSTVKFEHYLSSGHASEVYLDQETNNGRPAAELVQVSVAWT